MKIHFSQVYIDPNAIFHFSHIFQSYISRAITKRVIASAEFINTYGNDWELMFRVSAKTGLLENEIRGPTVFKKTKDVEYTVFLPYDVISNRRDGAPHALRFLLKGVCAVLQSFAIEVAQIEKDKKALIEHICADPKMFVPPEFW